MPRRPIVAALALIISMLAVAGTAHAQTQLPRLAGQPPAGAASDWFDDHSVSGDNHLSWSPAGGATYTNVHGASSEREPHDLEWESAIAVGGPGNLEICGYPSGTVGWMRAYQVVPGAMSGPSCPALEPAAGQVGWFRYVYGRHSPTGEFDRWHVMDLERAALVPMTSGTNAPPAGTPTLWDNHWGTCLNLLSGSLNCVDDRDAPGLDAGVASATRKVTGIGDVDAQTIPITVDQARNQPDGRYQIVTLTNPYGMVREDGGAIGSVNCVTVDFAIPRSGSGFGEVAIDVVDADPGTCLLPTVLDAALTGPGGFDPMAGGDSVPGCVFTGSHCWPDPPGTAPQHGDFTAAHSLATGNPSVIASMSVAQGSSVPQLISATGRWLPRDPDPDPSPQPSPDPDPDPSPAPGVTPAPGATPDQIPAPRPVPVGAAAVMPAPPAASTRPTAASRRATSTARTRARSALRTAFGRRLQRLRVSCRIRPAGASTCKVTWRKSGARYGGRVHLRNKRVNGRVRWQYRVDVKKRKHGRTTRVRGGYRTGGLVR